MPYVHVRDGQAIHVRICGRGEPVVLLHGLGMKSSHWLPFIWPYLGRFQFFMPDFRGAGGSAAVRLNQADVFQNHMEDVQDIVAHFRLRNFRLVGYSLGGSTALHWQRAGGFDYVSHYLHVDQTPCIPNRDDWPHGLFGAKQPDFFAGLRRLEALLSHFEDTPDIADLPYPARLQAMELLGGLLARVAGRRALGPLLVAAARWPWLLNRLLPLRHIPDIRAYLSSYLERGQDYRPSLRDCRTPVTVLIGMRSPLYHPAGQATIAELVPDSRIVRFEKSGHVPLMDEPLRFRRELGAFLLGQAGMQALAMEAGETAGAAAD